MKYKTRQREVTALQFDGTTKSSRQIQAWVEGEIPGFAKVTSTIFEPKTGRVYLCVMLSTGVNEVVKTDWVVIRMGKLYFHSDKDFQELYEIVSE